MSVSCINYTSYPTLVYSHLAVFRVGVNLAIEMTLFLCVFYFVFAVSYSSTTGQCNVGLSYLYVLYISLSCVLINFAIVSLYVYTAKDIQVCVSYDPESTKQFINANWSVS